MTHVFPPRPSCEPTVAELRSWWRPGTWRLLAFGRACCLGWIVVVATAAGSRVHAERPGPGERIPPHVIRLLNHGREIAITGGFDLGTSADFEALLAISPSVRTVDLNSLGGRVTEGRQVAKLIKARALASYTGVACASACTIAYLGGNPRYLGLRAKLGFHRYSIVGLGGLVAYAVNAWGEQELVLAGVSAPFAARVFATPSSGAWFPDADALIAAHVVTQVVNELSFSMHASDSMRSTDSFIASIGQLPDFAALRRAEPKTFSHIVNDMRATAQGDVTVQDVYAPARAALAVVVARYRPLADDQTQVEVAALAAEQGEMLSWDHPDICLKVLDRTRPFWDYAGLLAPGMWDRKMALDGRIIDAGAMMLAGAPLPPRLTDQALAAEEGQIWSQVRAAGHDPDAVDRASNSAVEQRAQCLTKAAFMRAVAALPITEAGPLMRHLERRR